MGFAIDSALAFADYGLVPEIDLAILRAATALASVGLRLQAFVWDCCSSATERRVPVFVVRVTAFLVTGILDRNRC